MFCSQQKAEETIGLLDYSLTDGSFHRDTNSRTHIKYSGCADSDSFYSSDSGQSMPFNFVSPKVEESFFRNELPTNKTTKIGNTFSLMKVGTCHVIVKNSEEKRNSWYSIPGTIPFAQISTCEMLKDKEERYNSSFEINKHLEVSYFDNAENDVVFHKNIRKVKRQMQVFLNKLQHAIASEGKYIRLLTDASGKTSLSQTNSSNNDTKTDSEPEFCTLSYLSPPKLGKVHVELQLHIKAWDGILDLWREKRETITNKSASIMVNLKKEVEETHWKILFAAEHLIDLRLKSISTFLGQFYQDTNGEKGWIVSQQFHSYKRLCKIIETYNKALRKLEARENLNYNPWKSSIEYSLSVLTLQHLPSDTYNNYSNYPEYPQQFTSDRIMLSLLGPSKQLLAAYLHKMLSMVKNTDKNENDNNSLNWAYAHNIEVDEDDVITHVCENELDNVLDKRSVIESLSNVKNLLRVNSKFVLYFLNCLAANTSLLRGRVTAGFNSPRSLSSSFILNNGDSAASSDDESVSSSLLGSGNGLSSRSALRFNPSVSSKKTVLWRDSWDKDEVADCAKSYMTQLVMDGANKVLVSKVLYYQNPSYQPTYMEDSEPFRTLAHLANMTTFELLPNDVLAHLRKAVQVIIITKAISSWEHHTQKQNYQSLQDNCEVIQPPGGAVELCSTTKTCVFAVHALIHILDNFSSNEQVAKKSLSRLEATLELIHKWMRQKIHLFTQTWKIRPLMQVCLVDLSHMTDLALGCLPLIEFCHNHVERRRNENPGTLYMATVHLRNIDDTITKMQSLKGECMKMYKERCEVTSKKMVKNLFPTKRKWRQKKVVDNEPSDYVEKCCSKLLSPVCQAVSVMDSRCQLTAVPTILSALLDSIVRIISRKSIRFNHKGATKLHTDIQYVIDYVLKDEFSLCDDVRSRVPNLPAVKRAVWVSDVLMSTGRHTMTSSRRSAVVSSNFKSLFAPF